MNPAQRVARCSVPGANCARGARCDRQQASAPLLHTKGGSPTRRPDRCGAAAPLVKERPRVASNELHGGAVGPPAAPHLRGSLLGGQCPNEGRVPTPLRDLGTLFCQFGPGPEGVTDHP